MLLLISDTNVLIDIEDGNLTPVIFRLPYEIAVPDILFELELREQHRHLLDTGLKVKSLTTESVQRAEVLSVKYPKPSLIDHSTLALAIQEKCPLLTGDRDLRSAAKNEGVEVHGTFWIVEELLKAKLIEQAQARISFDSMKAKGSRLPWCDVDELLDRLAGVENE
jgi:predicted nucleic acid-binding protein